ncbi:hypothetical protein AVEN_115804-1 [Araneus ventricosus]|uniref:Uncharacterized protein n=1 Tax=Araneus ventricosus TaxID=182803 RepID=A0A4Y2UTC6_ARAVE|nr:hypothetical protein AVEN_115804-1 [Araneus ventricosus]
MRRARALARLKAIRFSVVGYLRKMFHSFFSSLRLSRQASFHHGLRNFLNRGEYLGMVLFAAFIKQSMTFCTASVMSAVLTIDSVISASRMKLPQSARWNRYRGGY